jgi:ABC-type dipeptide/oligopeptide/nickel transport system ATPase component
MPTETKPLLSVRDLKAYFPLDEGLVKAVDGVSFDIYPGQVLGIVGESGCGKSVTMKAILQILERPARLSTVKFCSLATTAPTLSLTSQG